MNKQTYKIKGKNRIKINKYECTRMYLIIVRVIKTITTATAYHKTPA